jgi:hypothetical protein
VAAIEFDAQITNGSIEIPAAHRGALLGAVHVIVFPQARYAGATKIDELIAHPLQVPGFRPLTRDEAHERR